jgi:hypothetical protein
VLGDLTGDARHFCWTPCKYVLIAPEEVDELAFLFGVQVGSNLDGLCRVFEIDLHGLSIFSLFESTGQGGGMALPGDAEVAWRISSLNSTMAIMAAASSMLSLSQFSAC